MKSNAWYLTMVLVVASLSAPVQADKLGIGSEAPELKVTKWVKGKPLELASAKGKITVVEFWATWCGPCVDSIPHLTEIQQHYRDKNVRVIGVTAHDDGNTLEKVEGFVEKWGDKMGYTIGYDAEGETYAAFMDAAERRGIPHAFVIDQAGRIAWIGHPMGELDDVLAELVAGTYDIELAKRVAKIDERVMEARMVGDMEAAIEAIDEALALKPKSVDRLTDKFFIQAEFLEDRDAAKKTMNKVLELTIDDPDRLAMVVPQFIHQDFHEPALAAIEKASKANPKHADLRMAHFQALAAAGKEKEALALATETVDLLKGDATRLGRFANTLSSPERADLCSDLALRAVELAIEAEPEEPGHYSTKFYILFQCKNDIDRANATGQYLLQKAMGDADFLNGFAWNLLTEDDTKGKFNELALAAAEAMYKAPGGNRWTHIDTLALAKFENGEVDEAIRLEKIAIEKCDSEYAKSSLQSALERFEAAKKGE